MCPTIQLRMYITQQISSDTESQIKCGLRPNICVVVTSQLNQSYGLDLYNSVATTHNRQVEGSSPSRPTIYPLLNHPLTEILAPDPLTISRGVEGIIYRKIICRPTGCFRPTRDLRYPHIIFGCQSKSDLQCLFLALEIPATTDIHDCANNS